MLNELIEEFKKFERPEKVEKLKQFFRISKEDYGYEKDKFIGATNPEVRKLAKKYKAISWEELEKLMSSDFHEHRLCALFILIEKYKKEPEKTVEFYLRNLKYVNNWDLVDASAPYILGAYLWDKDRKLLYELALSNELWKQRISIVATLYFIRKNDYEDALRIAEILLDHPHHLIHKAVGWILREIGKRNKEMEDGFLKKYYKKMPRTMLRYAIERHPKSEREAYLKRKI